VSHTKECSFLNKCLKIKLLENWINVLPTFPPVGAVPEPAALPLFPAVLLGEAPGRGPGGLRWLDASPQPLPAQPRLPPQRQRPGLLPESPLSGASAGHQGFNVVLVFARARRRAFPFSPQCFPLPPRFPPVCTEGSKVLRRPAEQPGGSLPHLLALAGAKESHPHQSAALRRVPLLHVHAAQAALRSGAAERITRWAECSQGAVESEGVDEVKRTPPPPPCPGDGEPLTVCRGVRRWIL